MEFSLKCGTDLDGEEVLRGLSKTLKQNYKVEWRIRLTPSTGDTTSEQAGVLRLPSRPVSNTSIELLVHKKMVENQTDLSTRK